MPKEVSVELTEHPGKTIAQGFPNVTVLFTDIVGFTKISGDMTVDEVVNMLNKMVSLFDERARREGIEKIKTIGDAYMAAAGLTKDYDNGGAVKMIDFARGLLDDINSFNKDSAVKIQIRLGINTGNLVAGVIGKTKFIYDIWGDTVNVASRGFPSFRTNEPMNVGAMKIGKKRIIHFAYSITFGRISSDAPKKMNTASWNKANSTHKIGASTIMRRTEAEKKAFAASSSPCPFASPRRTKPPHKNRIHNVVERRNQDRKNHGKSHL